MISLLIKPVSNKCNLKCTYCFYNDVASKRSVQNLNTMSHKTLETLVANAINQAKSQASFAFQGGEPTLAGLDFFKQVIFTQRKYNKKKLKIYNSIQTNGILIDNEWAEFFKENNFLVGISLDGYKEVHELNRGSSFNKVMKAITLLNKFNVAYNILSVVTSTSAKHIGKIYSFFKKNNFNYLQFIPCLDKLSQDRGTEKYSLSPTQYELFLIALFDVWYEDFMNDKYISIRTFDNYVNILMGKAPESCDMNGSCSCSFVVEANGNVYPCDFYSIDEFKIGTIRNNFKEMQNSNISKQFIDRSTIIPSKCLECNYSSLCRNGCYRYRDENLNYYCTSYSNFFNYALPKMKIIIEEKICK